MWPIYQLCVFPFVEHNLPSQTRIVCFVSYFLSTHTWYSGKCVLTFEPRVDPKLKWNQRKVSNLNKRDALMLLMRWCTDAANAVLLLMLLMMLMHWCCWYTGAAFALMLLMGCCYWCCWCADALMLLMRWCTDAADAVDDADVLMSWCSWCADAADALMLLMRWCCWSCCCW